MKEIIILVIFYIVILFAFGSFVWGKQSERTWEFQKNLYFGKLLGQRVYYIFCKIIGILGVIFLTFGFILALKNLLK
ncbi:MAG: hypothetical protein PHV60_08980 [bacterium]|nr:hypothetical protein [bacterium]